MLVARHRKILLTAAAAMIVLIPAAAFPGSASTARGHDLRTRAVVTHHAPSQERARRSCVGRIALTFDDGPARATDDLLGILERRRVPATFFMLGERVAEHPAIARRVHAAGDEIGNHTWAHVKLTTQSDSAVRLTLRRTNRVLVANGIPRPRLMRPPYGAIDQRVRRVALDLDLVPVLWTIDPRDWESGTTDQIAHRILSALRPGPNIVLQHDGVARSPISIRAVPIVVQRARARGYCFTRLDPQGRPAAAVSATQP